MDSRIIRGGGPADLAGRVAVVSGAARGIGAAVARELTAAGARVAALDLDDAALQPAGPGRAGSNRAGPNRAGPNRAGPDRAGPDHAAPAACYPLDVRDSAAVEDTVARVERDLGPVDILVNVAGVLRLGAAVDLTDEDWAAVFAVNTHGVVHLSRAVARRMMPRRRGAIVTVGSNASRVPRMQMAAYAASKAATAAFTACLGLELAGHGIRCNVVSPGSTDTSMLRGMWTDDAGPDATLTGSLPAYRTGIPLRKLATPADIAAAVAFLVSDRAGHITMQNLCVDGGAALGA